MAMGINADNGSGYKVFSTALGAATPCYTMAATTYIATSTPTALTVQVYSNTVFSRKYTLDPHSSVNQKLSTGAIAGIAVGSVIGIIVAFVALFCIRRLRQKRLERENENALTRSMEMEEPILGSTAPRKGSGHPGSPRSAGSGWPIRQPGSPPTYEDARSTHTSGQPATPQELPGSMFIHEHHPAFQEHLGENELPNGAAAATSPPRTPTRPTTHKSPISPQRTPRTPRTDTEGTDVISPASTPRL